MQKLSTPQVARKLGLSKASLSRYILAGKVPAPPETMAGGIRLRLWSESDIERLKRVLPKIANGRKTRYKKKQSAASSQSPQKAQQRRFPGTPNQPLAKAGKKPRKPRSG